MVDSDIFGDIKRLDETMRRQILEKRRKSDAKFLEEDARVLVSFLGVAESDKNKKRPGVFIDMERF